MKNQPMFQVVSNTFAVIMLLPLFSRHALWLLSIYVFVCGGVNTVFCVVTNSLSS